MTEALFLQLKEEGTVNVFNLHDFATPNINPNYAPRMPEYNEATQSYEDVEETVEVVFSGTPNEMLYAMDQIHYFANVARKRQQRKQGNRAYIEYAPAGLDGTDDRVRSEILWLRGQFLEEPLSGPMLGQLWTWLIHWKRRHWWEALSESDAYLNNSNGTDQQNGITVVNHYDNQPSTDDNFVYIRYLEGTLPTPARIEITYSANAGGSRLGTIFISRNLNSTRSITEANSFQNILEGEDGEADSDATSVTYGEDSTASGHVISIAYNSGSTEFTVGETITGATSGETGIVTRYTLTSGSWGGGDAAGVLYMKDPSGIFNSSEDLNGSSGGANMASTNGSQSDEGGGYATVNWSGTSESDVFKWTLDSTYLNRANSNFFKMLIAFFNAPSGGDVQAKWKVKLSIDTIFETDWFLLNNNYSLQESHNEDIQLPPQDVPDDQYQLTLTLALKHSASGAHSVDIDFVQVSPTDSWRVLHSPAFNLQDGHKLVDDGIDDRIWVEATSGGNYRNFVGLGDSVMLDPNTFQILYFLGRLSTGGYDIDDSMTVKVSYRPRSLAPYIYDVLDYP